jgi:predicted metal-dependent enzyme (double-stranded beta helix superfamily)
MRQWTLLMFDAESFVRQCQAALTMPDPVDAVRTIVKTAIGDDALAEEDGYEVLLSSPDLTIQRIPWPPGLLTSAHEHRMWAVIGVYRGGELNHFYTRTPEGLNKSGERAVACGEVLVLDADVIHAVENPHREVTAALHVYGGDILGIERSAWGPDGREVSFGEDSSQFLALFEPMSDQAKAQERPLDDEARYDAFMALRAAYERDGRYPTYEEARAIIAKAWSVAS